MSTHTHTHARTHTYMHAHTRTHTHVHAQKHTCTKIHMHTHIHRHTLLNYVSPALSSLLFIFLLAWFSALPSPSLLPPWSVPPSSPPVPPSPWLVSSLPKHGGVQGYVTDTRPGSVTPHSGCAARQSARPSAGQSVCLYLVSLFLSLYPCVLLPLS